MERGARSKEPTTKSRGTWSRSEELNENPGEDETRMQENEKQFRFQDLEIWKRGAEISGELFQLAAGLEDRKLYRFAEQLRGATLSITNNIAEGSGSASDTDFANFLNMSRRSVFEVANILLILSKDNYLPSETIRKLLSELEEESRMLLAFRRTLKS
jgi:four helix bundle protein